MATRNAPIRSKAGDEQPCPCDLDARYRDCCGRFHAGEHAPTALALMRSRYSAFVLLNTDYLLHSWHPRTRPATLECDPMQRWLGLKIKSVAAGGEEDLRGGVSFAARYKIDGRGYRLEEQSEFERLAVESGPDDAPHDAPNVARTGRWVYVAGKSPD